MKAIVVTFLIACLTSATLFGQSAKYTEAMQKQLTALDNSFTKEALQTAANNFERIGNAEKTEWLPFYYAGYSLVMYCYMERDVSKIDALCDKADEHLSKAASMQQNHSEITTAQAMVLTARMQVDNSRAMTLGPKSSGMLQAAMAQQPLGNPRTMMNLAQSLYYTPEAFGGGKAKAIELMEKSLAAYATFKPESPIHPYWGKEYVEQTLGEWKKGSK
jgi:hypothetical protein